MALLPDEPGYCVNCKKRRMMRKVIQFPMRKGFKVNKFALQGECEKCGTMMFKLLKSQNHQSYDDKFIVNSYYSKEFIWREFGVGARGGIRLNSSKNRIVLFIDAIPKKTIADSGRNIYRDGYDSKKNLFRYTGQGQKGDQEFTWGNKWLLESRERKSEVHLFQQFIPGEQHKYVGLVSVESHDFERQKDREGNDRNAIVFWLKPLSNNVIQDKFTEDNSESLKVFDEEQSNESLNDKIELLQTLKDDLSIPPETRKYLKIEYEIAIRNIDFRKRVLTVYNHTCAICGLQLSLVEAAHIVPVSEGGTDELTNGIALCSNHHRAFDRGLIYINENLQICLNSQKITELSNSNFHMGLEGFTQSSNLGKKIKLPLETNYYPDLEYVMDRLKLMGINPT